MQWTLPLSAWQQARLTVRARRRCSVGQVLKSARTNTLPAGHRIGGVTCVMIGPAQTGPAQSRASIAAGSHHRARRGTLTRIPRFRREPEVAANLRWCLYKSNRGVKRQCLCRGSCGRGCNLGPARKVTTEVESGLYLLHVPCTVYRLKTQWPGTPAVPGRKRKTWYGALARMCAVVRNMTCW